ncbi:hypothetical protein GV792_00235 [Nocardia cyriacigeorgica]|uniref:hypothetical protein n=1 Tax=Nocardia cyriacigeorgica TaxID=135487 RepID=UPI0013B6DDC6|nr:hypothetical protein [Nocardia cyriacigeorgica]NEW48484.1 hypothetical protein [Nocardia cyriacigeorgica]
MVVFAGVGGWQLAHAESTVGVDNNVGYTLLGPLFAVFVLIAVVRARRLAQASTRPEVLMVREAGAQRRQCSEMPPLPSPSMPIEDVELARYNRYLAELNAREIRDELRAAGLDVFGTSPGHR